MLILNVRVRNDNALRRVASEVDAIKARTSAQARVDQAQLAIQKAQQSLTKSQIALDTQRNRVLQDQANYSQGMRKNVEADLANQAELLKLGRQVAQAQSSTTGYSGGRSLKELQLLQEKALSQSETIKRAQEMLAQRAGISTGELDKQRISIQNLAAAESDLALKQQVLIEKQKALGDATDKLRVANEKFDSSGAKGINGDGRDGRGGGGGVGIGAIFRGILPGGQRAGAGAVTTGIGLALAAAPAIAPGAVGLIMGGASAVGGLIGVAGTLKLALGGLNAAALTTQKGWNALTPVQQQLGMTLRRLDAGLLKNLESISQGIVIPGLNKSIKSAMSPAFVDALGASVQKFSVVISHVAQSWGKMFGSTQFAAAFGQVMQSDAGMVQNLLLGVGKLFDAFIHLSQAAIPLTSWLGKGAFHLADWADKSIKAAQNSGELTKFFDRAKISLQALGGLVASIGHLFGGLFDATGFKVGIALINTLKAAFEILARFLHANAAVFRNFFMGAILAIRDVIKVIGYLLAGPLTRLLKDINKIASAVGGWRYIIDAVMAVFVAKMLLGSKAVTDLEKALAPLLLELRGISAAATKGANGANIALASVGTEAKLSTGWIVGMRGMLSSMAGMIIPVAIALSLIPPSGAGQKQLDQVGLGWLGKAPFGIGNFFQQSQRALTPAASWLAGKTNKYIGWPNIPTPIPTVYGQGGESSIAHQQAIHQGMLAKAQAARENKSAAKQAEAQVAAFNKAMSKYNMNVYGTPDALKALPGSKGGTSGLAVLPPAMAKAITNAQAAVALATGGTAQLQADVKLQAVLTKANDYVVAKLKEGNLTRKQTLALEREHVTLAKELGKVQRDEAKAQNTIYTDALSNLTTMYQQFLSQQQSNYGSLFQGPVLQGARIQTIAQWGGHASPADLLKDVKAQNFQYHRLNRMIGHLGRRGAPAELVNQLRAAGPTAMQDIYELTKMSAPQWKQYVAAFKSGQTAIKQQTMAQLNSQIDLYKQHGIKVAQAIVAGITSQDQKVSRAIDNMLRKAIGLKPTAGYTPGPHKGSINQTIHIHGNPGDYHKARAATRHALWGVRVHTVGSH